MNRIDIIQALINKTGAKSYLEIGVRDGACFNQIQCENKIGVDPDPASAATLFMTSDEFFMHNREKFDIIFIDGLHHAHQVIEDINGALMSLNHGGHIVVHDCLPYTEAMQTVPDPSDGMAAWTGDVWKAWVRVRQINTKRRMVVVDTDFGCGIISPELVEPKPVLINEPLTYENYAKNRNLWMNVISVEQFKWMYL